MEIKVDTQKLIIEKQKMVAISQELETDMTQLEELIWSLSGEWQGETQKALSEKVYQVKKRYEKLISYIVSYADILGSFSSEYEGFEGEIAQKIDLI